MKKTIIISCAGKGSRLKMGIPKCLVEIEGKTLIERQLEELKNEDEIIVVVGYQAEKVITYINSLGYENVTFAFNYNYEKTATGASFCIGANQARNDFIIALDGDMIVHPNDYKRLLSLQNEFVCGEKITTDNPVYLNVDEKGNAISFDRSCGDLEWSGVAGIKKEHIKQDKWFVCDIMSEILPAKAVEIRAREIDTPNDYEEAKRWLLNDYDNELIIDSFFRKRFQMEDNYVISRYSKNDRDEYDYQFLKPFINKDSSILDLGCGTGILEKRLAPEVGRILGIDKYQEFLNKAYQAPNVEYLERELSTFTIDEQFDLILLFGITMYLTDEQIDILLENIHKMMKKTGVFVIKNQWGINDDLTVSNYSEQLDSLYYAKYRSIKSMYKTITSKGFSCDIQDIYPSRLNKWHDTHEYALVLREKK